MVSRCIRINGCSLQTYLRGPIPFPDLVSLQEPHRFLLHGRGTDLVNIGGHRGSLTDLNQKLNEIEGVQDGVFFLPDETGTSVTRLIAFVVAPGKAAEHILSALRTVIDPLFLPDHFIWFPTFPVTRPASSRERPCSDCCRSFTMRSGMGPERIVTIGAEHPSLAGHFPGHPVVPGVVMLGEIMNAIREMAKEKIEFVGMPSAVHVALNPGGASYIRLDQQGDGTTEFTCTTGSRLIAVAACATASSPMIPG
jgi:hypothetical protein